MPIDITDVWADDGINRRNGFVRGVDRMRFVCSFYISDDLLTRPLGNIEGDRGTDVYFDFAHIDWRNNNLYHDYYWATFGPDPATGELYNWWWVWMDFGIIQWEPAMNWFQVIAEAFYDYFHKDVVSSEEKFVRIFRG